MKIKITITPLFLLGIAVCIFWGCSTDIDAEITTSTPDTTNFVAATPSLLNSLQVHHEADGDYTWDETSVIEITLNGDNFIIGGVSQVTAGSKVLITAPGNYRFSGSLNDGQIEVNTSTSGIVRLILNGVSITSQSSAPISIMKAKKTVVIVSEGTQNFLSDTPNYLFENSSNEPNATLFSKDNLSIGGKGTLTIYSNYNDGIMSKDGLVINGPTINITSVDDGIRGKDYLVVRDGAITINANGDGLKSDNDESQSKGYIYIEKGTLNIISSADAIQGKTNVLIASGDITIQSGGGSNHTLSPSASAKGLKSGSVIVIDNGVFNINSADDAVHANNKIVINGGTFTISSGDDGIHADSLIGIHGGSINITKCYEGIESRDIMISGGTISIVSKDDGLNCAGGVDGSGMGGWQRPSASNFFLMITGGYIAINASGDGIDVNGSAEITGGKIIVNGPTSNGDAAIDYDVLFKVCGGDIIAVGSAGMAQAPSSTSTQNALLLNLSSVKTAGTIVHIKNTKGDEVLTFAPKKNFQSVVFSSPTLIKGESYEVYLGGSCTGSSVDGLYSNGLYSGGTLYTSFKVSSVITRLGNSSGRF